MKASVLFDHGYLGFTVSVRGYLGNVLGACFYGYMKESAPSLLDG